MIDDQLDYNAILTDKRNFIKTNKVLSNPQIILADRLLKEGNWVILTQATSAISVMFADQEPHTKVDIEIEQLLESVDPDVNFYKDNHTTEWDEYGLAALEIYLDNLDWRPTIADGQRYTRQGMIQRVMREREEKSVKLNYKLRLGKSIYGEHTVINERGMTHKVMLWDLDKKTGYANNLDWRTNKLGTTKHIMHVYNYLEQHPKIKKKLKKTYPFIEITLDPLKSYQIHWRYIGKLTEDEQELLNKYFKNDQYLSDEDIPSLIPFLSAAMQSDRIVIRPEVVDKIERYINQSEAQKIAQNQSFDYSLLKLPLFAYQKKGVEFVVPKTGAIIADEMGLGKTAQAIASIVLKKQCYQFSKNLIICPASLKYQWKEEISKFSHLKATVVEGKPDERKRAYLSKDFDVWIINYERVLRDLDALNAARFQYVILDEAQKIKNFNTKTAVKIKQVNREHSLVITGTPLENKIGDIYSILQFVDPYRYAPLWEFSYQYCMFHPKHKDRITAYYNIDLLKKRLSDVLLRREKRQVIKDLPNVVQKNVFVKPTKVQADMHYSFYRGLVQILAKKFKTHFDYQRIMLLLNNMRMVSDSSFLIDKETNHSSKLIELEEILKKRLDLPNNKRKLIIFSEWINMLNLIGELLKKIGLDYVMLTGKVPVNKRGHLIEEFEQNENCRVFLSTESGGAGLNLQMADLLINFELPWNPAKKNQRIGRIDRLGQKSQKLTVFNFITLGTIETKIMSGLVLKQNLFDGVLNQDSKTADGKNDFIRNLQEMLEEMNDHIIEENEMDIWQNESEKETNVLDLVKDESEIGNVNTTESQSSKEKYEELERVLSKGMDFLSGIYEMSSGKKLNAEGNKTISVDRETGEVTMKFKIDF